MGLEDRALLALLAGHDRVELSERMVRGASNWTLDARVRCPDNQSLSQSLSLATLIVQTLLTERLFGAVVGASATRRGRLDRRHALLTRHLSSCDGIDQMSMLNSTLRYGMMPSHDTAPPRTTPAPAASAVISHSLLHLPAATVRPVADAFSVRSSSVCGHGGVQCGHRTSIGAAVGIGGSPSARRRALSCGSRNSITGPPRPALSEQNA